MRHPSRRRGFTLLEVILVLAILVLLSSLALPSLSRIQNDGKLDGSADAVRSAWTEARSHAVEEGQMYRFAIAADSGKFRVAPDRDDYWTGDAPPADDANPATVYEDNLPQGIRFTMSPDSSSPTADSGGWTRVATFLTDGTCRETSVEIRFSMTAMPPRIVRMRGMTGIVEVTTGESTR